MLASNNKQDGGHVHLRHTTNVYWLVNEADKKKVRSELIGFGIQHYRKINWIITVVYLSSSKLF